MDPIVCISLVNDCTCLFSFVHLLYLSREAGDILSPLFWFWIRKWVQSFVFRYYMIVYVFFHLYTSYFFPTFSWRGWGHAIHSFSDLGFENGPNRLYFVSTWLYMSFFVCTPLTFVPLPGRLGTCCPPFSDFGFENGLNRLYFGTTWLYTSFFRLYFPPFSYYTLLYK